MEFRMIHGYLRIDGCFHNSPSHKQLRAGRQ